MLVLRYSLTHFPGLTSFPKMELVMKEKNGSMKDMFFFLGICIVVWAVTVSKDGHVWIV
jgi:hypothetical protein